MKKRSAIITLMLAVLALGACTPIIATRGNLLTDMQMQKVQVQKSSRADVVQAWGPPTVQSPFDQNTWYYIGEKTSQKGLFQPEVQTRRIVRVKFNTANNDTVVEVAELDPKLAQDIKPVSQTTPAAGKEYTFLQQLIGNVGKYNADPNKK